MNSMEVHYTYNINVMYTSRYIIFACIISYHVIRNTGISRLRLLHSSNQIIPLFLSPIAGLVHVDPRAALLLELPDARACII